MRTHHAKLSQVVNLPPEFFQAFLQNYKQIQNYFKMVWQVSVHGHFHSNVAMLHPFRFHAKPIAESQKFALKYRLGQALQRMASFTTRIL